MLSNTSRRKAKESSIAFLLAAIKECSSSKDLTKGHRIHAGAIESGHASNIYISSSLVNMYVKCKSLEHARQVFDQMKTRDVVSWNSLILGYAENGEELLALELMARMENEDGCLPDALTFVAAAKACIRLARKEGSKLLKLVSLEKAMGVHARAAQRGNLDAINTVGSIFIDMYGKCGSSVDARRTFDRMVSHDVVTWTALILSHAETGKASLALQLFQCMDSCGCSPNARTFVAALKACGNMEATDVTLQSSLRSIHLQAESAGCDADLYVACSLINMYARFGSMSEAHQVFTKVKQPDVASWNALIAGYVLNGEETLALKLFATMPVKRDHATFSAALNACIALASKEQATCVDGRALKLASLHKGISIHRQAQTCNLEVDVAEALITMYARCGSLIDAHRAFDRLGNGTCVAARAALMSSYVENGEPEKALDLFLDEQVSDARLVVAASKAWMVLSDEEISCELDRRAVKLSSLETCDEICSRAGSQPDPYVACTLVSLYSKCGSMADARKVFDTISDPDVALWNALMAGYVANGEELLALEVYARMTRQGCQADGFTFSTVLNACAAIADKEQGTLIDGKLVKLDSLCKGMAIHSHAAQPRQADVYVGSSLVSMYGKCGCLLDAWNVFVRTEAVDVVLITSMMLASVETGQGELALRLYSTITGLAKDSGAVGAALKACIVLADEELGREVQGDGTRMVKLSSLELGMKIHRGLDSELEQSVANILIEMYGACGSTLDARSVFDKMEHWNSASWTVLMVGYVKNDQGRTALDLYLFLEETRQMVLDCETMACALKACSLLAALEVGKMIHAQLCRQGVYDSADELLLVSLVDLYGKCGCMENAHQVVDSVATRDSVVWSSLLAGYSRQGNPDTVFALVRSIQQENIALNSSSYASILSACSHAGLVNKGKEVFEEMQAKFKPSMEHYGCMVDMLNRANQVEEAVKLSQAVPCRTSARIWRSILSASCKYGNTSMAQNAFNALLQIDPKDSAAYVLMANMESGSSLRDG